MPKQVGVIKLKGKMGGISFYQLGGNHLARMGNGPSKKRIKQDPGFARTRENNTEFSGCARIAKAFRSAFAEAKNVSDPYISSRLTGIFKRINVMGEGVRGKRPISLSLHREQLTGFDFNPDLTVTDLFTGLVTASNSADRKNAAITIEKTILRNVTKAPANATHIRFTQMLGIVSDYAYDEVLEFYAPMDSTLNTHHNTTPSAYLSLDSNAPVTLNINSMLPEESILNEQVSVIQCIAVSCYQQKGNEFYLLKNGSAMKVTRIF